MPIGKIFSIFCLMIVSTATFAEYYFVGDTCAKKYNNRIYKDTGSLSQNKYNYKYNTHYSQTRTYSYSYNSTSYTHTTYNLDLITGDDDPYVYPGMNIDH